MDTKMQALEKAQKKQREIIIKGGFADVGHWTDGSFFIVGEYKFEYSDPKPLEKDMLCLVFIEQSKSLFLYSTGKLNEWYPPGSNSRNYTGWLGKTIMCDKFEIIETPFEFERIQTPDHECINSGCYRYVNKWQRVESDKFLNGDCERCMVLIGTPSNLKAKK